VLKFKQWHEKEYIMRVTNNSVKFSDVLREASRVKKANGEDPRITAKEFKALREEYKKVLGKTSEKLNESKDEDPVFTKACEKLSEKKVEKGLPARLTESEKSAIRAEIDAFNTLQPNVIKAFREAKLAKGLSPVISENERKVLLEEQQKAYLNENAKPAENKEPLKEEKTDHKAAIREARVNIYKAKKALREGDLNAAADATQAADASLNAVDAAQEAVPQNIADTVAELGAVVDDLKAQCGVQDTPDMGANPEANLPPVTGAPADNAPAADPNAAPAPAAPAAPIQESTEPKGASKLEEIKARLAQREAALAKIKESVAQDFGKNALADIGTKLPEAMIDDPKKVDKKDSPDTMTLPTQKELAAGTAKDVVRWPTEKTKGLPTTLTESKEEPAEEKLEESLAEQFVTKKLQENEDSKNWNWSKILASGILSPTLG